MVEAETMEPVRSTATEPVMSATVEPIEVETERPSSPVIDSIESTEKMNSSLLDESRIYVNEVMERYPMPSFTSSVSWDDLSARYK